jgi:cellulose synthase/poly-beta-1,6-N-acetylglucosamine synthase-like glycosyltransferase
MNILVTIVSIFFLLLLAYAGLSVLYLFVLSFSGRFFYRRKAGGRPIALAGSAGMERYKTVAVLVPAYKEDGIILSTASNLLGLDYPSSSFRVYIIADSFRQDTLRDLRQLPLTVVEVNFAGGSTKTKALNEAFSRIDKLYDIALICDADNMLASDFLQKINNAFQGGAVAVQGRRIAKNLDTSFAILDACSEGINNHIFRKGANAIGLASAVIGSGMAFDFPMIRQILSEIRAVGGFDKPLQLKVVEQGETILYLEDALVFDEKVDSPEAFKQQRRRWVSSQFVYLRKFMRPALGKLFQGNFSYFNLAVANNLVLPRAFLMLGLPVAVVAGFLFQPVWGLAFLSVLLLYVLTLALALPSELINKDLFAALLSLPRAIGTMVGTLFHLKKANRSFIHTIHTKTEVSNPAFKNREK